MRKATILLGILAIVGTTLAAENSHQTDNSITVFWEKFSAAVTKGDKEAVARMSQFPISMPYGVPEIRNRAQLIKRYRSIFYFDHNATTCFREAKPRVKPEDPKLFEVGCKNPAGDEVIIYLFSRTRTGWKFIGQDNINE